MQIYTNTATGKHYNAEGAQIQKNALSIYLGDSETLFWQLCTQTPTGINPESWTKDNRFIGTQVSAKVVADSEHNRLIPARTIQPLTAGAAPETLTLSIYRPNIADIPESGTITLSTGGNQQENIYYTSRTLTAESITVTLEPGTVLGYTYPSESEADISNAPLLYAYNAENSDTANGTFVFQLTADTHKLRKRMEYMDINHIEAKTLELAVYSFDFENNRRTYHLRQQLTNALQIKNTRTFTPLVTNLPPSHTSEIRQAVASYLADTLPPGNLPPVSSEDNGKILQVENGQWQPGTLEIPEPATIPSVSPLETLSGNDVVIQPGKHYTWQPYGLCTISTQSIQGNQYAESTLDIDLQTTSAAIQGGVGVIISPLKAGEINHCKVVFSGYVSYVIPLEQAEEEEPQLVIKVKTTALQQSFGVNLTHASNYPVPSSIDWGDGNITFHEHKNTSTPYSHVFNEIGEYLVKIPLDRVTALSFINPVRVYSVEKFVDNNTLGSLSFSGCTSLAYLYEGFTLPKYLASMADTFKNCSSLITLPSSFKMSETSASPTNMFNGCSALTHLPDNFRLTNACTSIYGMFQNCRNLTSLPEDFTLPEVVTNCGYMFHSCNALTSLPDSFTLPEGVLQTNQMFYNCSNLRTLPAGFTIPSTITNKSQMFYNCPAGNTIDWQ